MSLKWLYVFLFLSVSFAQECQDVLEICAALEPICMENILKHQLKELTYIVDKLNISGVPLVETGNSGNEVPLVLGSQNGTSTNEDLPILRESLPILRESLPLIRESLPLIRHYIDPLFDDDSCQTKSKCGKRCPRLRKHLVKFVEALCPRTCKSCATMENLASVSGDLAKIFN